VWTPEPARDFITCKQWIIPGFSHAIWAILGAHFFHLVLVADFAYYYMRAITRKGLLLLL